MKRGADHFRGCRFPSAARVPWLVAAVAMNIALTSCGNREPIAHPLVRPSEDVNAVGLRVFREGDLAAAEEYFLRGLASCEALDYLEGKARCLYNLGLVHRDQGKLEEALDDFRLAETLFARLDLPGGLSRTLAAQATVHAAQDHLDDARHKNEKALEIAPESVVAEVLANLAAVHFRLGELSKARSLAEEAAERSSSDLVLADALFNLARVEVEEGKHLAAERTLGRVLDLDRAADRRLRLADTLTLLGSLSLEKGSPRRAADYLRRAAGVLEALGRQEQADRVMGLLPEGYE